MTTYFRRVRAETPTRVWVNNPTIEEIDLALGQGARGCTTNPGYGGGLLRRAPGEVLPLIVTREDIDEIAARLTSTLEQVQAEVLPAVAAGA